MSMYLYDKDGNRITAFDSEDPRIKELQEVDLEHLQALEAKKVELENLVDSKLASKADSLELDQVNQEIETTKAQLEDIELSKATKDELSQVSDQLTNKADLEEVNTLLLDKADKEELTNVNAQLAEKATKTEARLKVNKLQLEDMDAETLAAIEGGAGTSFNLLSIPQDGSVTPEKTDFVTVDESTNLFDKSNITTGGYLNTTNGSTVVSANYFVTNYIKAKANDVIRYTHDASLGSGASIFFYDANKNYLGNVVGVLDTNSIYRQVTLTNPNIAYIRTSYNNSKLNTAMITVNNAYPANYIAYFKRVFLDNTFKLNEAQKSEVELIASGSKLSNKIITANGDSIQYGAGYVGGFSKIIADRNAMTLENIAVSGGTITAETYNSTNPRHWVSRTISNMRSDADYILLEGGVNDAALQVSFGSISTGYTATLDDTTFCGAFEKMLKDAIIRFPGKKICFVIVHRLWFDDHHWHTQYYPAIVQMCKKWGIPYCDLYNNVPSLNLISSLKSAYTKDADGWHPNEDGYRKFYADKVEAFLETL